MHDRERVTQRGEFVRSRAASAQRVPSHDVDRATLRPATHGLPPILAALERVGVPPGPLYTAAADAERTGVAPFDALSTGGAFAETELIAALARALGVDVATSADAHGPQISIRAYRAAMNAGLLLGAGADGPPLLIVATRGHAPERLARHQRGHARSRRIALASPRLFADIATARAAEALAADAADGPASRFPELTVAHGMPTPGPVARGGLVAAGLGCLAAILAFETAATIALLASGVLFLTLNLFRLVLLAAPPARDRRLAPIHDADLPAYTVLVALYREAAVIPSLLDAIERLDYPVGKLDIKILTEHDDEETREALRVRPPRPGIEVLTLPPGKPQTKPRALNIGLAGARGSMLTVFDAEDRPEPRQLRIAIDAFRAGGSDLACVQARLAIDNVGDGWLTRHFAIEYAALFDVTLPALSTLGLPIALGGTSNHFRVDALNDVGGWDAGNVTEDADLGLRLARLGWKTRTIASTTWEEAPTTYRVWLKQRTRWMKGFMVTALVHGRRPYGLFKSLGPLAFVASQLLIGGVALTALAYPLVAVAFLWNGFSGAWLSPSGVWDNLFAGFHVANLIVGFSAGLATAWIGAERRCPQHIGFDLLTLPLYWLLVGFAAWRALTQIAAARTTHWEKTPHGVSSRRATPPPFQT